MSSVLVELWLPVFGVILAAEMVLSLRWNTWYFSRGVPIFRREVLGFTPQSRLPTIDELDKAVENSAWPRLTFRQLSASQLAFREVVLRSPFSVPYVPMMRGLISMDGSRRAISVVGYANWLMPVVFLFFFVAASEDGEPIVGALIGGALVGLSYWLQASRFRQVVSSLEVHAGQTLGNDS